MHTQPKLRKLFTVLTITTSTIALSGCQQYLTRSDKISPYAGDSMATNRALQTGDPWPQYVYDTDIETDGARQADAVERYRKPVTEAGTVVAPTATAPATAK